MDFFLIVTKPKRVANIYSCKYVTLFTKIKGFTCLYERDPVSDSRCCGNQSPQQVRLGYFRFIESSFSWATQPPKYIWIHTTELVCRKYLFGFRVITNIIHIVIMDSSKSRESTDGVRKLSSGFTGHTVCCSLMVVLQSRSLAIFQSRTVRSVWCRCSIFLLQDIMELRKNFNGPPF
jgi:hypothetical protein